MRKIVSLLLSVFSASLAAQSLSEFSTSMDFEEFEVVTKYLQVLDAPVGKEISANIAQFKRTTAPGKRQRFDLKKGQGYMLLEREDDYAFTITVFTTADVRKKIEEAYERAGKELGI